MLVPSLLFILVMAIVAVAIAIVAIARSKMLNKLFKRLLIGCLSFSLFVTSPLLIIPLNLQNDAVFAAGNDPCATPGKDGPATSIGIVNTYFAATAGTLTAGIANTTITLGAQSGAATLVTVGDMLMLIQMQDADINSDNSDRYGDGSLDGGDESPFSPYTGTSTPPPSTGASGFNNAGRYEYVTATAVTGGGGPGSVVTIKGTGTNKGLNYSYTSAAATSTTGQKSYQIIRVPQYSSLALNSGTTAPAWDGTVGGVFAVDVAGTITFGGGLDLWGKGFRGGAGRQLSGTGTTANSSTFYRTVSVPTGDTTANARNGSKGEGVAGTPKYVIQYFNSATLSGITFNPSIAPTIITNANEGYPDGSYGRGAPGNAGGGSTDGNTTNTNDMNSGGGGGANGGDGGRGGRAWSSQIASGGYGGKKFSSSGIGTDFDGGRRLFMGGGGGAGTTNNGSQSLSRAFTVGSPLNDYDGTNADNGTDGINGNNSGSAGIYSSGGAGGGIAIIRANSLAGSGTIDVRGVTGLSTGRDGGGGGGAGGSVYISANPPSPGSVTVNGDGGAGGWATFSDAHGPGGGGGGGAVFRKTPIIGNITANLAGGLGGQTGLQNNTNAYNFFSEGGTGTTGQFDASDSTGISSSDVCVPQLRVTKTTSTPTIVKPASADMTATYKIVVSNAALKSSATNVSISDVLPSGFTFAATQPAQTVTCSAGASGTYCTPANIVNPATGAATVSWGTFTIPEAESVTIDFNVNIPNAQALGTYQNPATATYDDPARTVANGTTTASYNPASSTGEDVTITAAPQTPFVCDGRFYQIRATGSNSTLYLINRFNSPYSDITLSSTLNGTVLNGMGYNPLDNYMYALLRGTSSSNTSGVTATNALYRLSNNAIVSLGGITGLPIGFSPTAADFGPDGSYYVSRAGGSNELFKINIAARTATEITLNPITGTGNIGDFAYNPIDGQLYGVDGNTLFKINPVTGDFTTGPLSVTETWGTAFFDPIGTFYAYSNGGRFYRIDKDTGVATQLSTAPTASVSDGAVCQFTSEKIDTVKSAGTVTRVNATTFDIPYTVQVKNTGLFNAPNVQITENFNLDPTFTAGSPTISIQVAPASGTLTVNPSFTGITPTTYNLLSGLNSLAAGTSGTITFTVRLVYASAGVVPTAVLNNQVYASTITSTTAPGTPNPGFTFPSNIPVPPPDLLTADTSTNSNALPVTANGDTPSPTPVTLPTASNPNLLLVKRITAINDAPITTAVNDGVASADDNANWRSTTSTTPISPTPPNDYLKGDITRNDVKPGDRIEYTIYFLSAGDTNITSVTICDLIPPNTTFVNNAYDVVGGGSNLGVVFANSTITPTSYLTGLFDSDQAKFYPANTVPPTTCKNPTNNANLTSADNTDGIVVVDVIASPATLPFATGIGTPANSYGLVRFQVKVK
ncbi:MAG: hypothetical protein WCP16_07710 [Pseudanabaena sp. ELA645]|jgi:uncharacterized repeat protein (TIGR01451 family)